MRDAVDELRHAYERHIASLEHGVEIRDKMIDAQDSQIANLQKLVGLRDTKIRLGEIKEALHMGQMALAVAYVCWLYRLEVK